MENNKENKARFFAQYLGQGVGEFKFVDWNSANKMIVSPAFLMHLDTNHDDGSFYCYLELTSLQNISDEDAIEVARMSFVDTEQGRKLMTAENGREDIITWLALSKDRPYQFNYNSGKVDYLRSKGYALPWIGLSVEELVEYGWIKLKE